MTNVETTNYVFGTVAGPHPFPAMVRDFQRVIGDEARAQVLEREGRLPVLVTARYLDGDAPRTGSAIVDVAWRTDGRVLLGRSLTITAARLRERGGTAKRLDTLWLRDDPRRPSF